MNYGKHTKTRSMACAIIANADYIVSDDAHFNELKSLPPTFQITVHHLDEFLLMLKSTE